ncbi:ABC transporter permease [candidate division KSB1 bacterium]
MEWYPRNHLRSELKVRKPPKTAEIFLSFLAPDNFYKTAPGDLEEVYNLIYDEKGQFKAKMWYWSQVLRSIPVFLSVSFYRSIMMINNYMKISVRNIKKNKDFSLINILGLAIGMACGILILLWVQNELSYDKFHENDEDLYFVATQRLYSDTWRINSGTPPAFGPALKEEYPEVLNTARLQNGRQLLIVKHGDKMFTESIRIGDFSLLEMFTFPLIKGNLPSSLSDPYAIFITEQIALKYFENEEPVGRILLIDNQYAFTVAGVLHDMPGNSMIQFDFLVPFEFLERHNRRGYTLTWTNLSFKTFAQLHKNSLPEEVNRKIENRIIEGNGNSEQVIPVLRKYSEIRLYGISGHGGIFGQILLFSFIAIVILLIACFNFINLSTARAGNRAVEVGIRKVVGATRLHMIRQFFGESLLYAFISLLLAYVLAALFMPEFNELTGKQLTLDFNGNLLMTSGSICLALITGLVAGSYPALFLSSFRPVRVLKGTLAAGSKNTSFRKLLVVTQFVISIILIICTIVVHYQLWFVNELELGYEKDQVVYFQTREPLNSSTI